MKLAGLHHVSALSAQIDRSDAFYRHVLGLRPLLRTVNQDAPGMYHLFWGDGAGTPGSDITVFDLRGAVRERRGNNSIVRTTFRVAGERTLAWWTERLRAHGVAHGGVVERDSRLVLDFEDPAGTQLSLVDDGGAGAAFPWEQSAVPAEHQPRGLGYSAIMVPELAPTNAFLAGALGLAAVREYRQEGVPVYVYAMRAGGVQAEVHVHVRGDVAPARYGAGGVHHVALRVPGGQSLEAWGARLDGLGYRHSGVVERHYFRSLYVREPNHVLFELATDEPGFAVDGPIDGERLSLPPFLEPRRGEIEAQLAPLGAGGDE